jgi:hypothetical protein
LISTYLEVTEEHLHQAAGINQWVFENLSVLKHVYSGKGLKDNFLPRIIMLGSRISSGVTPLLSFLRDLHLEVHRYKFLRGNNKSWLEITKLTDHTKPAPKSLTDKYRLKKAVELTPEELGAFFDAEAQDLDPSEEMVGLPAPELDFKGPYFN